MDTGPRRLERRSRSQRAGGTIATANDAARVEPRRAGYFNAVQVFPYSPGALYQIYASPGQITDIALEPGEQLTGSGPLAAGDTVRWIVGDTESGNGDIRRVHIMVKPTRPAIETNLVVNTDRRTYDRLSRPASPFVVQAGTIIPAALITGIRSDLPGQLTAQVTENIYDSPTGRARLIPQGARLIGIYDSQVAFGQSRVLLVWTRLIMPNGRSVVLERQAGADAAGYAGLEDEVDNHWGALFKAALLSTLLGVGSELGSTTGTGGNSDVITALRRGSRR